MSANRAWTLGLLSVSFFAVAQAPGMSQQVVTSQDGTRIAYTKAGKGPPLVIVTGALASGASSAELVQLLSLHFTVYTYDRRGRGVSGDTKPYSPKREIEDLAAVIDAAGGSVHVYGKSSGAALALQATASLPGKVTRLAIYEAPYDDAPGAAGEWKAFRSKLDGLLAADRRADAVAAFLQFVGMPAEALGKLKASPEWAGMEAMAPTLAYDTAILGDDRSVPVDVAARVKVPTLVMDGGASQGPMPFMRATAAKLGKAIPGAQRRTLEGQAHDVSAKAVVPVLVEFFGQR
jgi:pimeloyl-ACP methyl ester carboxylesterase